ncbi:hypothetical protein XFLAVUS301_17170 [Xanthobacter flavus]|uniref:Uncharacterized protein n=1 Tax=Xanthobacter flavus TaxID=281 RepID=A0A9W6CQH0_XANFL|nr:hypothetical protein XFLAVUS301_17170 [Xanthobacter flavus]
MGIVLGDALGQEPVQGDALGLNLRIGTRQVVPDHQHRENRDETDPDQKESSDGPEGEGTPDHCFDLPPHGG